MAALLKPFQKDTINVNKYVRHSLTLIDQLNKSSTGPNLKWKYYEDDSHGSTVFPAQLDALRFFYSWFEFKEERKYQGKYGLPENEEESFSRLTERHFQKVSEELGYDFFPTVPWLISTTDMLLNYHKLPKQAQELLLCSKKYYPGNKQIEEKLLLMN